jgi:hypothetical protein
MGCNPYYDDERMISDAILSFVTIQIAEVLRSFYFQSESLSSSLRVHSQFVTPTAIVGVRFSVHAR